MNITVIGGGYVGLVTSACLADLGHKVLIIEIDKKKVELIKKTIPPIFEEGLEEILIKNIGKTLFVDSDYSSIGKTDVFFLCVGTPPNEDGSANLQFITDAAKNRRKYKNTRVIQ